MEPTIVATGSFRSYRYQSTDEINPDFDGTAFLKSWGRFVGSKHRHWQTRELILCWSVNGPHPATREMLREQLESDPRNIASVLAAIDARDEALDRAILAANAAYADRQREGGLQHGY